jgi:hypothetical protein
MSPGQRRSSDTGRITCRITEVQFYVIGLSVGTNGLGIPIEVFSRI